MNAHPTPATLAPLGDTAHTRPIRRCVWLPRGIVHGKSGTLSDNSRMRMRPFHIYFLSLLQGPQYATVDAMNHLAHDFQQFKDSIDGRLAHLERTSRHGRQNSCSRSPSPVHDRKKAKYSRHEEDRTSAAATEKEIARLHRTVAWELMVKHRFDVTKKVTNNDGEAEYLFLPLSKWPLKLQNKAQESFESK